MSFVRILARLLLRLLGGLLALLLYLFALMLELVFDLVRSLLYIFFIKRTPTSAFVLDEAGTKKDNGKRNKTGDVPLDSMPLTAAPDTALSAFFSVSFVASTGPRSSRRTVVEKNAGLPAATALVRPARGARDARVVTGAIRVKSDMVWI